MMHRVFVYGTLKRGHWNNILLKDSFYAGEAATPPKYRMATSGFPVILEAKDGEGLPVAGELYHVNDETLARLDRLESEGRLYERKVIDVMERGEPVQAYVYVGIQGDGQWVGWPAYRHTNKRGELDWNRFKSKD